MPWCSVRSPRCCEPPSWVTGASTGLSLMHARGVVGGGGLLGVRLPPAGPPWPSAVPPLPGALSALEAPVITSCSLRTKAALTTPLTAMWYLRSKLLTLRSVVGPKMPTAGVLKPALVRSAWSVRTSLPLIPCRRVRLPKPLFRGGLGGRNRKYESSERQDPRNTGNGADADLEQRLTLLFRTPTGLADGLALKEMRYAGIPAIRPRDPDRVPAGSPIASARPWRFGWVLIGWAAYTTCKMSVTPSFAPFSWKGIRCRWRVPYPRD